MRLPSHFRCVFLQRYPDSWPRGLLLGHSSWRAERASPKEANGSHAWTRAALGSDPEKRTGDEFTFVQHLSSDEVLLQS